MHYIFYKLDKLKDYVYLFFIYFSVSYCKL